MSNLNNYCCSAIVRDSDHPMGVRGCRTKKVQPGRVLVKEDTAIWTQDVELTAVNMPTWRVMVLLFCKVHKKALLSGRKVKVQYVKQPTIIDLNDKEKKEVKKMIKPESKGVRCGNCSTWETSVYHPTVEDVRACYGAPMSTPRTNENDKFLFFPKSQRKDAIAQAKLLGTAMLNAKNGSFMVPKKKLS